MEVLVLGGSAASPNPGQGCAGYLVTHGSTTILLDCGPGTLPVLRAATDVRAIDAIIISHMHADHMLDLVPLRYGLKYGPGATAYRLPLWLPPDGREMLERLAAALAIGREAVTDFFESVFALAAYDPASPLRIGDLTIRFQPTQHPVPCWAMRIEAEGQSLVYLADTGPEAELARFAEGADLVICEATLASPELGSTVGHLTPQQAGALAAEAGARSLLLTHYWVELGPDRLRADAADAFGGPVLVAEPYLRIGVATGAAAPDTPGAL
ncbi:MAG: MBL fold metallo-hydrolase [Sphaerobacter sp.]|nr:MBL fold metallo-hydrolase [Sphaerobacter sp.]